MDDQRQDYLVMLADARPAVLAALSQQRRSIPSDLPDHPQAWEQFLSHAGLIYDSVLASLSSGAPTLMNGVELVSIARARAAQRISTATSLATAAVLHEVIVETAGQALPQTTSANALIRDLSTASLKVFLRTLSAAAQAHLAALLAEVSESHATERRRLSRELHDQTSHSVGTAMRQVEMARTLLTRTDGHVADADRALGIAVEQLVEAMSGVRSMLDTLRDDADLTTLRASLETFIARSPGSPVISVEFDGDELVVPLAVRRQLLLMVRECLRNAQRHAQASTVAVHATFTASQALVRIVDDGFGMPVPMVQGSGVTSLMERAALLDGQVEWLTPAGRGTIVVITVPLPG